MTPMPEKPKMGGQPLTRELAERILGISFTDLQWGLFGVIIAEERKREVQDFDFAAVRYNDFRRAVIQGDIVVDHVVAEYMNSVDTTFSTNDLDVVVAEIKLKEATVAKSDSDAPSS
jgi:hypothetical protein